MNNDKRSAKREFQGIKRIVSAGSRALKRALRVGTGHTRLRIPDRSNLDLLVSPGSYYISSPASAATMVNAPLSFPGAMQASTVVVGSSGLGVYQEWRPVQAGSFPSITAIRSSDSDGKWGRWHRYVTNHDLEIALGKREGLDRHTDLDDLLDEGEYEIVLHSTARTIINGPSNIPFALGPAVLSVLKTGNRRVQYWTAIRSNGEAPVVVLRGLVDGIWSSWVSVGEQRQSNLTESTDLDELLDEKIWISSSSEVIQSLKNLPESLFKAEAIVVNGIELGDSYLQELMMTQRGETTDFKRIYKNCVWGQWVEKGAAKTPVEPAANVPKINSTWSVNDTVWFWGDSSVGLFPHGLAAQTSKLIDNTVHNRSRGGLSANEVLLRAGVLQIWATPVGGILPSQGSVTLNTGSQELGTVVGAKYAVVWAGVQGEARRTGENEWTFFRDKEGPAVSISVPTLMESKIRMPGNGTHIFIMGGNDVRPSVSSAPESDKVNHLIASYRRAVESVPADPVRHVLIGGLKTRGSTQVGDNNHRLVRVVNEALRKMYPENFVDRNSWLCFRGLESIGENPSKIELKLAQAGIVPASVYRDDTHVRNEIVVHEARELWAPALLRRGWVFPKADTDRIEGFRQPGGSFLDLSDMAVYKVKED